MNYFFVYLFLFFAPLTIHAAGFCDPQLMRAFDTALQLEEVRQVWNQINQEGAVRILAKQGDRNNFTAYWEGENRIICVNVGLKRRVSEQISSIIFEMHNALRDKKTVELYNQASEKRISRDTFAKEMERLEYENSLDACDLVDKGVRLGIYPRDCFLQRYPNFEEFLREQKMHGHYQHYMRAYQEIQGMAFS